MRLIDSRVDEAAKIEQNVQKVRASVRNDFKIVSIRSDQWNTSRTHLMNETHLNSESSIRRRGSRN